MSLLDLPCALFDNNAGVELFISRLFISSQARLTLVGTSRPSSFFPPISKPQSSRHPRFHASCIMVRRDQHQLCCCLSALRLSRQNILRALPNVGDESMRYQSIQVSRYPSSCLLLHPQLRPSTFKASASGLVNHRPPL